MLNFAIFNLYLNWCVSLSLILVAFKGNNLKTSQLIKFLYFLTFGRKKGKEKNYVLWID